MVTVQITGLQDRLSAIKKQLLSLTEKDAIARIVATTMAGKVRERIHEKGLNSDASNIGDYSDEYMMVRRKNNRGSSKKVIISLTRELENDFAATQANPIKTAGGWGIGFLRNTERESGATHGEIAEYMEEKYGDIWKLTKEELDLVKDIAQGEADKILKDK